MRLKVDFKNIERIAKVTENFPYLCYQCGTCTASCLLAPSISVRHVIRRAQIGAMPEQEQVWKCISCKYCDEECPRGVEISKVMRGLKLLLYEEKKAPEALTETLWRVYEDGNPLGSPKSERALWAKELNISGNPEVILYACCMSAYDRRLQNTLKNLVDILQKAGVSVGILGEQETCCGDVVYHTGEDYFLEELAQNNVALIEKFKPNIVLTVSPHCYNVFKNLYPKYNAKISAEVLHHVQYLSELIDEGKIKPGKLEADITYHDPCYLGRWNGVYEEPRNILQNIEGVRIVEMEHSKSRSLCCGGGGGALWMENKDARRVTKRRIREAVETESNIMATACPYCIRMFEDELKVERIDIQILDVVELLHKSIER